MSEPIRKTLKQMASDHQMSIREIDYVFVDDEFMLNMNKEVLQHDYYTDIITFDYSEDNGLSGEIYISTDTVQSNAIKYGEKFHVELIRVIFHGALHMLGYKDKNKANQEKMRQMENKYIKKYKSFHVEH